MNRTQWYIGAPNGVVLCIRESRPDAMRGELWHSYSASPTPFENVQKMVCRSVLLSLLPDHG